MPSVTYAWSVAKREPYDQDDDEGPDTGEHDMSELLDAIAANDEDYDQA